MFLLGYKVPISYANMTTESWTARTYNRNWMSQLKDDVRLSELSIPGTHNSATATYRGGLSDYVRTQSIDIRKQLDNEIRFLDIRAIDGVFTMHHDRYYLNQNFGDVLNKTVAFLRDNPEEVVYMRLKQEYSSENDHTFNHILNTRYLQDSRWRDYFTLIRLLARHEEKSSFFVISWEIMSESLIRQVLIYKTIGIQ
ncbi:phosphatidylinositol-specific phospholipase C domain-containing protein [Enterococcus sp. FSL W8-0510]|uniref:phosphatidylinositol-specific phospholipase C domain-containing protein n=1 Tax=Enterococcus sp. FSL W8-0510 TaxID=2954623 RepID=UPI0030F77478